MTDDERAKWIIKTLAERDFDIAEFHALQTEIAAKWKADRADLAAAKAREPVAWLSTVITEKGNKLQRLGFTREEAEMANTTPIPLFAAIDAALAKGE